jgi:hypothetical protein
MKSFNDSVVYVLNGKPIPGTVLKSIPSEGGELLTLLYADPEGEKQIAAGSTRYVGQIASMVKPLTEGSRFGWKDNDADAEIAGLKKDSADLNEQFLEAQKQISEAIAQRDEATASLGKVQAENADLKAQLAALTAPATETNSKQSAVEEIDAGGDGFGEGNDPSGNPIPVEPSPEASQPE